MSKRRLKKSPGRPPHNQRRTRLSFAEVLSSANRHAHERANRRGNRREHKSVRAAIAATAVEEDFYSVGFFKRVWRWLVALLLLPFCGVTTVTLLSQFSNATLNQGFWQTAEFWHFAIGVLVMIGWFWSGLAQTFFLYLYVLGHEATHALFVWACWGKVSGIHVSAQGGYVTTNKTNWVIALSPYFVPIWSILAAVIYGVLKALVDFSLEWDKMFYAVIGLTWTFHYVWTLWMIPREQPDLRENGTMLSLVVIYLGNVLVLVALLCVAGRGSLLDHFKDFGIEWLRHAATWGYAIWEWSHTVLARTLKDWQT
jgi:hypothetical protein